MGAKGPPQWPLQSPSQRVVEKPDLGNSCSVDLHVIREGKAPIRLLRVRGSWLPSHKARAPLLQVLGLQNSICSQLMRSVSAWQAGQVSSEPPLKGTGPSRASLADVLTKEASEAFFFFLNGISGGSIIENIK